MKNWLRKIKIAFFSTIVILQLFAFFSPIQVKAQLIPLPDPIKTDTNAKTPEQLPVYNAGVDKSIQDYLCTPNGQGTDLFDCVDRLYRFGVTAGAISIVFFIVYAGYIYITGGEASKTKAKQTIYSALTGMAILLGSYVLLSFINPNLVQIKTIQPPIFSALELPSCEDIGFADKCIITAGGSSGQVFNPGSGDGKAYGSHGCSPITNNNSPASIDNLSKSCWGKYGPEVVKNASIVAANETGGRPIDVFPGSCGPGKLKARCTGGEIPVYGIFQINMMAHPVPDGTGKTLNCPDAFSPKNGGSFCSTQCTVTDKDLYNKCYQALHNITNEFTVACSLYEKNLGHPHREGGKGKGFDDWGNVANQHGNMCGF